MKKRKKTSFHLILNPPHLYLSKHLIFTVLFILEEKKILSSPLPEMKNSKKIPNKATLQQTLRITKILLILLLERKNSFLKKENNIISHVFFLHHQQNGSLSPLNCHLLTELCTKCKSALPKCVDRQPYSSIQKKLVVSQLFLTLLIFPWLTVAY